MKRGTLTAAAGLVFNRRNVTWMRLFLSEDRAADRRMQPLVSRRELAGPGSLVSPGGHALPHGGGRGGGGGTVPLRHWHGYDRANVALTRFRPAACPAGAGRLGSR